MLAAGLDVIKGLGVLALSILFAAYFYFSGESAAQALRAGMVRVAQPRRSGMQAAPLWASPWM